MTLAPGVAAQFRHVVSDADTAIALGSGDVPVLATPRVLALAERATCLAVASTMPAGQTTVGSRVVLTHRSPTAVGQVVDVEATLVSIDGIRLTFEVRVVQDGVAVAEGTVIRVLVDRDEFLDRLGG